MTEKVIAIDGPAYVGKSAIAQCLAGLTGYSYINTGHMYRSVAKMALDKKISPEDSSAIAELAKNADISFRNSENGQTRTFVGKEDWSERLNDYSIIRCASQIAVIPELRAILTEMQRTYAERQTIIMEGRDIGSVVFPNAEWKFFITASSEVRAKRMLKMMGEEEKKKHPDSRVLIPKVETLDESDRNRKIAPLLIADDAIVYDNSESPTAMQDACVLFYYIHNGKEIISNSEILKNGIHLRTS